MSIINRTNEVMDKIEICLDGMCVTNVNIVKDYIRFIGNTVEKEAHNIGIVAHTGSICFDAVAMVYLTVYCMLKSETKTEDFVKYLNVGDMVIYRPYEVRKKYEYRGQVREKNYKTNRFEPYILLVDDKETIHVPQVLWSRIEPYFGESTSKGRKIKDNTKKREFYLKVLELTDEEIPALVDKSIVFVMEKEYAEKMIKGITIKSGDTSYRLTDITAVSYFSEEGEYPFSGNQNKVEPCVKICRKVSIGRKLVVERSDTDKIGLYVCGKKIIDRGETEIPELLDRRSLQFSFVVSTIDIPYGVNLVKENEKISSFVTSKDFLAISPMEQMGDNDLSRELVNRLGHIRDKVINKILMPVDPFGDYYNELRNNLFLIKNYEWESVDKEEFIMHAYSLTKLYSSASFSLQKIDIVSEKKLINITTPDEKLHILERKISIFPSSLEGAARRVVEILLKVKEKLFEVNEKEIWIRKYVIENKKKKIAIIVPKAYYATIIRDRISTVFLQNVTITTVNRFNYLANYDAVIFTYHSHNDNITAVNCMAAKDIFVLLYSHEKKGFEITEKVYCRNMNILQKKIDEYKEDIPTIDGECGKDEELERYISEIGASLNGSFYFGGNHSSQSGTVEVEVIKSLQFAEGQRAFLTKNYKAYVFDESKGVVEETNVSDIREGDTIVFTENNSETKDIVKAILDTMVLEQKLSTEQIKAYNDSKVWKDRMLDYMKRNNVSSTQFANRLKAVGSMLQEVTIRNWLDEDSHTVGPRHMESIVHISKAIEDDELEMNASRYFDACRSIRSIRREILTQIGKAIMDKISGKKLIKNVEFAEIYERIDSLAVVLQVERVTDIVRQLPAGMTNRPINL